MHYLRRHSDLRTKIQFLRKTTGDLEQLVTTDTGKTLVLNVILALISHSASLAFLSDDGEPLNAQIAFLYSRLSSGQIHTKHTVRLLKLVLYPAREVDLWACVYELVECTKAPDTPPSSSRALSSFPETPSSFNTGSSANTSERRRDIDNLLKDELDQNLVVDYPNFIRSFFGKIPGLDDLTAVVFERCKSSQPPLYHDDIGWTQWPQDCKESEVLAWLRQFIGYVLDFAKERGHEPPSRRRCVTTPNKPIPGSVSKRKIDISITYDSDCSGEKEGDWSRILIPGELKNNPQEDKYRSTWLDLSRYSREIFTAQDTRRFTLGFTLCGPILRLWEFDRLGGISSLPINIHQDGLRFIYIMLGYLWMNEDQLGFDPTIFERDGKRWIEIERNGNNEQLILKRLIKRQTSLAGRASTCWEAFPKDQPIMRLAVKDSWQFSERLEEGELLRYATAQGVNNVARYYHHETVRIEGYEDDINSNVRKGLVSQAQGRNAFNSGASTPRDSSATEVSIESTSMSRGRRKGGKLSTRSITKKRSSSSFQNELPSAKRSCSTSPVKQNRGARNRIHRRVIVQDVGKSIHLVSSQAAMIRGLLGAVKGLQSLEASGIRHRDISAGNIMLDEEENDGFLIDLDLAVRTDRNRPSGAPSKTGTKIYMGIGPLYGEPHLAIDDMESIFWFLFWYCIHCTGPKGKRRNTVIYEKWNYKSMHELASEKAGIVTQKVDFEMRMKQHVSEHCQCLIPLLTKLRDVLFPNYQRRSQDDDSPLLYDMMKNVLQQALNDTNIK